MSARAPLMLRVLGRGMVRRRCVNGNPQPSSFSPLPAGAVCGCQYDNDYSPEQRSRPGVASPRWFSTAEKKKHTFDPVQASSAQTILQTPNPELSPDELALKTCLLRYQKQQPQDDEMPKESLLEELQQAYMNLGHWEEALEVEQTKCDLYYSDHHQHTDEYADSIHTQGKLYLRQEDFPNSKRLYEQALEYFSNNNRNNNNGHHKVQRGHVLISLAGWYFFQNQLDEAMAHLQEAEALLDSNPALLVKCLDNQGLIHRLWGEFDTALDAYRQALQVVVEEETQHALMLHVADMLVALEQVDEALETYQELLRVTTDRGIQGVLWHNIATIHVDQGEYELALEEFRQALQYKQETGGEYNPEVAKTFNSMGALYAGVLDEKLKALECFQQVLLIARINASDTKTDPDVLNALQNIAAIEKLIDHDK